MAGLSRSHHNAVHRLLRERLDRVELNRTWQQLHAHFELGRPAGRWLHFDAETRRLLQRMARDEWGFDPLEGVPDGSRREVAARAVDEKIARRRPDDNFVLVKGTLPAPLPPLAPGLSLRVALERLDSAAALPELDEALLATGNRAHFTRQFRQARQLEDADLEGWQDEWQTMKRHAVSIKQQHMLALGSVLRQVPRR